MKLKIGGLGTMKIKIGENWVEGTPAEIASLVNALGDSGGELDFSLFYRSSSNGVVLIRDMDSQHIRNAVIKLLREWVSGLKEIRDNSDFLRAMVNGYGENKQVVGLVAELKRRGGS